MISKDTDTGQSKNAFFFKADLFWKFNHNTKVGAARGKCRQRSRQKVHCKVLIRLDGTVGGYGKLLAKGNFGRGDNTLLVRNGTGDFDGVAGKLTVTTINKVKDKVHFDLIH